MALLVSDCCCPWLPQSVPSQTKTHCIMTDATAVTIRIPLRLFYSLQNHFEGGYLTYTHLKNVQG